MKYDRHLGRRQKQVIYFHAVSYLSAAWVCVVGSTHHRAWIDTNSFLLKGVYLSLVRQTIYRRHIGTILVALLVHDESLAQPISSWILQIVRLLGVEGRVAAGASVEVCEVRGLVKKCVPFT